MKITKYSIKNQEAISEIIGTQLLILITVSLFSIIYLSILFSPPAEIPPSSDIIIVAEGENIIFSNEGGKDIDLKTQIELLVDGEEHGNYSVNDLLQPALKEDGVWNYGEQFTITSPILKGKDVTVLLIDTVSNTLISHVKFDAVNPLSTMVNTIDPYYQTSIPFTVTARSNGAKPDNITLWYRHEWTWEDQFENNDLYVLSSNNMSFDEGNFVTVNKTFSGIIDYVDQISNQDGSIDIGSHSNFNAQTAGPDSTIDILLEENTAGFSDTILIDRESFEGTWPPSGWSEYGYTYWNKENNDAYDGSWSADFDGQGWGTSGYLFSPELDCADATSIFISFYFKEEISQSNEFEIYLKDNHNNWDNVDDLGESPHGWNYYTTQITDPQYFNSNFQICWYARDVESEEHIYLDYVYITKESGTPNYELDLEVQWDYVNHTKPVENLCIYCSQIDIEDLIVEVWNENQTQWDQLINSISTGWNNISVSNWLTSSLFTIRFKDGSNISDSDIGSWEIDCAYLSLVDPVNDFSYQGNITSLNITKPVDSTWETFYANTNNNDDSLFSILDENNQVLLSGLDGKENSISAISENTIKLYGSFNGPVTLDDWQVSVHTSDWTAFETDEQEPWAWSFDFPEGIGLYSFYSTAKKTGWYDENPPSNYDTQCFYDFYGG